MMVESIASNLIAHLSFLKKKLSKKKLSKKKISTPCYKN